MLEYSEPHSEIAGFGFCQTFAESGCYSVCLGNTSGNESTFDDEQVVFFFSLKGNDEGIYELSVREIQMIDNDGNQIPNFENLQIACEGFEIHQ